MTDSQGRLTRKICAFCNRQLKASNGNSHHLWKTPIGKLCGTCYSKYRTYHAQPSNVNISGLFIKCSCHYNFYTNSNIIARCIKCGKGHVINRKRYLQKLKEYNQNKKIKNEVKQ